MPEISYYKLRYKVCEFPECNVIYKGTGYSKFCQEHRKPEHRKIINKNNKKKKKEIADEHDIPPNIIYKHNFEKPVLAINKCALCGDEFEIMVMPGIFVYPVYCIEHRNKWKRKRYVSEEPKKEDVEDDS